MGTQLPSPKREQRLPQFSAHLYCGQTAECITMPLGMEVGLSPGDFVLDGDLLPSPKKGGGAPPPKFSGHVYCGQTAGCIKMPLGTKVGVSSGDSVLDGDPAPPHKGGGAPSPIFGPFLLWPNGWMDHAGIWHGGRPQSSRLCVRWGPSPLPRKGAEPLLNFWPISIVAKRLDAPRCHLIWN